MFIQEQWQEFRDRIERRFPGADRREAIGASNAPFVLENGFRFGLYNVDSVDEARLKADGGALVLVTRLVLPPHAVLHLALAFQGDDLAAFGARKSQVARQADKVRVYIHATGIYLRQDRDPDRIDPADPGFGNPVPATVACFADVERESHLDPVQVAYINYLTALLGPAPLERLGPQGVTTGAVALNLRELDFESLASRIEELGARYTPEQVARYHIALNHLTRKHFVILTGISGTGKTLLAKAYAYATYGVPSLDLPLPSFYLVPVSPDWTDPAHILGYFDAISGRYRKTPFVSALLEANQNRHRPVFVCLDEMNIAQPEHYFANVLSAMETGEPLNLHDSSEADAGVPPSIPWPENLYIAGTVNIDETTRSLSPKILDRSNVIDMSEVDVKGFCDKLRAAQSLAAVLDGNTVALLEKLTKILKPHALHFGYRTIEEIAKYLAFAAEKGLITDQALDIQIEQKILTKLRGGHELDAALSDLAAALVGYAASARTVERFRRDLEWYGSFQYWT